MKSTEIKELTTTEINEKVEDLNDVLVRMRINHAVSPLDNPNKISETKKDIARLKTELRMRQLNENK